MRGNCSSRKGKWPGIALAIAALLLAMPFIALADDFADYKTSAGKTGIVNLPTVENGWFVASDFFPEDSTASVDGRFQVKGRLIVANDTKIYMQRTYGSDQFDVVATVAYTMDPSFIHVSPDGGMIALGLGYGQPLLIVPTSVLSIQSPPVLTSTQSVRQFSQISYYDGDWADNRYFIVNGGQWPTGCTPPYSGCDFQSGVGTVDTQDPNPSTYEGLPLVLNIPGASADVDVDSNGNLITGLGWAAGSTNRTGELKVWSPGEWDRVAGSLLNYDDNSKIVAQNVLSAAYLGEDAEGNYHVGGGDAFGTGGVTENGYAAILRAGIVNDIATGHRTAPAIDGNNQDTSEYKFFAPDPCRDDSSTGILSNNWGRGLAVMWNPTYQEDNGVCYGDPGSATDYWMPGVRPRLTIYYPGSAPDTDGDGIPDASDNAYLTPNPEQEDTDGDGYGNAADADFNNDGVVNFADKFLLNQAFNQYDKNVDMNSDGLVNFADKFSFGAKFGSQAPWY